MLDDLEFWERSYLAALSGLVSALPPIQNPGEIDKLQSVSVLASILAGASIEARQIFKDSAK